MHPCVCRRRGYLARFEECNWREDWGAWRPAAVSVAAAVVLCLVGQGPVGATEEPQSDVLRGAVEHRGDKDIVTGEFRFTAEVTTKPPSAEEMKRRVEQHKQYLREALKSITNAQARRGYEKAIETADQYVPPQLIRNAGREMRYYFVLGGSSLGGDRYVEFHMIDKQTGQAGPAVFLLRRSLGAGRGASLYADGLNDLTIAGPDRASAGIQDPHLLGRLTGSLEALGEGSIAEKVKDVHVGKSELGASLREVSGKFTKSGGAFRLIVDPSRGFITPLIEERDPSGTLRRDWKSEDYFQPPGSTLWFPSICTYREFKVDAANEQAPARSERYTFSKDGVVLNNTIPSSRFRLQIPKGRTFIDNRGKTQKPYAVAETLEMSLDDLDSIGATRGLVPIDASALEKPTPAPLGPATGRWWLVTVNVVVVVCVIAWWAIRKRGRAKRVLQIVIAVSLASNSGCGTSAGSAATEGVAQLSIVPEKVQLGEVAVDGNELPFSIEIRNGLQQEVRIAIAPSCGCTVADTESFPLRAGESRKVGFALSTRGRTGTFNSAVRITATSGPSGKVLHELSLPIEGYFRDDWTAQPQRVVLSENSDKTFSGAFAVSAPSESWKDVVVDVLDAQAQVRQTGSSDRGNVQTRNFRVSAKSRTSLGSNGVIFFRHKRENTFLVVPILAR